MTYNFGRIVIYQPFLHYLRSVADGAALSKNQLQYALICIKIASTTITRSEAMMKKRLMCSASWISIYTIFLSVICLIFLIAAHTGTATPGEAWKKAETGIKLLAHCRCREGCATACLDVLKVSFSPFHGLSPFESSAPLALSLANCNPHRNWFPSFLIRLILISTLSSLQSVDYVSIMITLATRVQLIQRIIQFLQRINKTL